MKIIKLGSVGLPERKLFSFLGPNDDPHFTMSRILLYGSSWHLFFLNKFPFLEILFEELSLITLISH